MKEPPLQKLIDSTLKLYEREKLLKEKKMLDKLKPYRKFIVAVIGSALTWAIATYADDPEVSKYLSLASAILTALGVYQIPNKK